MKIRSFVPGCFGNSRVMRNSVINPSTVNPEGTTGISDDRAAQSMQPSDFMRHTTLGCGTFGDVILVTQKGQNKKPYTIKIQSKYELLESDSVEALIQEKNVMATFDSPFLTRLEAAFQNKNFVYLLMDFVPGGDLSVILSCAKNQKLKEKKAKFLAAGIFAAIDYLHRHGYAHRDIKAENILIDKAGYPVLTDFGFTKKMNGKSYTICGTLPYMAPEILDDRGDHGHDQGVDHWAYGVLIFEIMTGKNPFISDFDMSFEEQSSRICVKKPLPLKRCSAAVAHLVSGLLTKDPRKRLGSLINRDNDIRTHPWFADMNLSVIESRKMKSPCIPHLRKPLDTSHFFEYSDKPRDERIYPRVAERQQQLFQHFDFWRNGSGSMATT